MNMALLLKMVAFIKKAKKLSQEQGAFMGAVIDPRYGRINTYSTEILKQIFKVAKDKRADKSPLFSRF